MSTMKGAVLLTLLLANVSLSFCCRKEGDLLVCTSIQSDFPSGGSTLLLLTTNVGEINSTVLLNENLASITRVVMSGVSITKIAEGAFSSFQSLTSLVLDHNLLKASNFKWLGNPAILTELNVSENHITVLNGAMVDGFSSLKKLDLARNRIRTIDPHTFTNLSLLSDLNLSYNNLTRLTPQMFNPIHSTNMSLHGNPWDCSCAAEDSIEFIKDLQSRSLLLYSMDVICASPPSVRGLPVWDIMRCTPGPSPETPDQNKPTLTTLQYQTMSRPPPDTKTTLVMKTMPTLVDTTTAVPQPPSETDIVPMLITTIVVLCVLLLLIIVLAVLYRRKRNRNVIAPRAQKEPVSIKSHHEQKTIITVGHLHWDIESPCRTSFTGVRAKSANAILFKSPFGVSGNNHKAQSEVKDVEESNEILGEMVKNKSELYIGLSSAETIQNPDDNLSSSNFNSDNVSYLSIGSYQKQANYNDNHPDRVQGQKSKAGRGMHRISTWPPTAVQWQERCKRLREQEKEEVNGLTIWTQAEGFKIPSDAITIEHIPSVYKEGYERSQEESTQMREDTKGDETEIQVEELPELNDILDAISGSSMSNRTDMMFCDSIDNVGVQGQSQHLKSGGNTQMINVNHDKAQSSRMGSTQRGETRRCGSKAPSGGASPGDETPLEGDLDLLHEVVNNHGRWTRDRWRQIHVNKQRPGQQPGHR